jgi:hypothetical protein
MVLRVKKNKTPKAPKARKSKTMLQKQQVSQNVKVNIYKPSRVPRDYKVKQLPRDGAGGVMPNLRELPSSSFQIVNNQPRPLLYNELFGNARPVSVSPFERLLASQAVDDNRQAQVGELRNSLESARLKAIQREPILRPARRAESEQERFTARATASTEDNRRPFSVTSVDEQGTLGASLKARIPQVDYLREQQAYTVVPPQPRGLFTGGAANTIDSVLQVAQREGLSGQAEIGRGESDTFRVDPNLEEVAVESTYQEAPDRKSDGMAQLGVPDIPDRLVSYLGKEGTGGDLLQQAREEVVPATQGAIQEYEVITEAERRRGRPRKEGTPEEQARREYNRQAQAKHVQKRALEKVGLQQAFDIARGTPQELRAAAPVKSLIEHFGGSSKPSGSHRGEGAI